MTISSTVVKDSVSPNGIRITTLQLRYPKFIHGEAKTHRLLRINDEAIDMLDEIGFMDDPNLSRNASSSRAIPVSRLIQDVLDDPAMPVSWGRNQSGMQAAGEHDALIDWACEETYDPGSSSSIQYLAGDGYKRLTPKEAWLLARDNAVEAARAFAQAGYHKQVVNRLIEPFCHINVVVTATEWTNFFALRRHSEADPTMHALADAMWASMEASTPTLLSYGQWHLPYVGSTNPEDIPVSVARCARVSYLTHDGRVTTREEDLELHGRLVKAEPLHASPAEHQATADISNEWRPSTHGNLVGWIQYRKLLPGECAR